MNYEKAFRWAVASLKELNIEEAKIDAWYAMEEVSGISKGLWYVKNLEEMPERQFLLFESIINRLKKHEPISYILGNRDFCGLNFLVNENVLIPRQDTENLVMRVVDTIVGLSKEQKEICVHDLCTGSGCIAISIAKLLADKGIVCHITASDVSEEAIKVAKTNNERLEAGIEIVKSDMFNALPGRYDIIVSNPPYIPEGERINLDEKVKAYEPGLALFGGEDGLDFYRIIAKEAKKHLNTNGYLFLEIGFDQGKSVPSLLMQEGYEEVKVYKDYNNLDRNVVAIYKGV